MFKEYGVQNGWTVQHKFTKVPQRKLRIQKKREAIGKWLGSNLIHFAGGLGLLLKCFEASKVAKQERLLHSLPS